MAHSATEKETKEDLSWTLNQSASSAANIGTTVGPAKNIRGTAFAAAAKKGLKAAGVAKLWQRAALHNQAECWSKNIALKIQILLAAHSKQALIKQMQKHTQVIPPDDPKFIGN